MHLLNKEKISTTDICQLIPDHLDQIWSWIDLNMHTCFDSMISFVDKHSVSLDWGLRVTHRHHWQPGEKYSETDVVQLIAWILTTVPRAQCSTGPLHSRSRHHYRPSPRLAYPIYTLIRQYAQWSNDATASLRDEWLSRWKPVVTCFRRSQLKCPVVQYSTEIHADDWGFRARWWNACTYCLKGLRF